MFGHHTSQDVSRSINCQTRRALLLHPVLLVEDPVLLVVVVMMLLCQLNYSCQHDAGEEGNDNKNNVTILSNPSRWIYPYVSV